jgi:acetyl-CoA carboxylase biotin carboxyl carrier protein
MPEEILAPVTGNVWRVLIEAGNVVSEGDELIILESMKMEIPIEAPRAGTVTRLLVAEGVSVEEGDAVAEIE